MSSSTSSSSFTSSCASDLYERSALWAAEDILSVCKLEEEEQQRRINDVEGENAKRVIANNFAVLFNDSVRATWFQRGSSFVLSLLGGVRSAVSLRAIDITSSISNKAGDLGHQAALNIQHTAGDLGNKAQEAVFNASHTLSNKAGEVGLNLAHKAEQTAQDVSSTVSAQANSAALNIKEKSLETAHSVSSLAQEKASDLKNKGVGAAQGASSLLSSKVHEYTQWLKSAVINLSFYKRLGSLTGHTNMTFAMIESENERRYRMTSSNEIHAINNALKVASLIKELHPEFYRPSSEPNILFATRLLEESERSRRIFEAQTDKTALINAKSIAELIVKKSAAPTQQLYFKMKPELAEEIKQKPFAAAM